MISGLERELLEKESNERRRDSKIDLTTQMGM